MSWFPYLVISDRSLDFKMEIMIGDWGFDFNGKKITLIVFSKYGCMYLFVFCFLKYVLTTFVL